MIRPMETRDIPTVAEIESLCFTEPWSSRILEEGLNSRFDWLWVFETETGIIAGYCNLRIVAGDGELMRIAVRPEFRGYGLSKKLMDVLVDFSKHYGASQMSLEVRVGNETAINLYKTYGFQKEAVRKEYYRNPVEDALIMMSRAI